MYIILYICTYIILYYLYDQEFIITKRLLVIICIYHWIIGLSLFITLYIIIGLLLVVNEKKKKNINNLLRLLQFVYYSGFEADRSKILFFICCGYGLTAANNALFAAVLNHSIKIDHFLLSLLLGAKTPANNGQKTAASEVFSTSALQLNNIYQRVLCAMFRAKQTKFELLYTRKWQKSFKTNKIAT